MSGPRITLLLGDFFGGAVNTTQVNGETGTAELDHRPLVDSEVFELFIGGRLNLKEKVFKRRQAPRAPVVAGERLVPVNDKVRP